MNDTGYTIIKEYIYVVVKIWLLLNLTIAQYIFWKDTP